MRGIIAILFDIVIVMNPGIAIMVFILSFAGFALHMGSVTTLIAAFGPTSTAFWLILEGIAGIGLGCWPSSIRSQR